MGLETFKTAIKNYPIRDLSTKQNLEYEALQFIEHIAKSKQLISKKSNKRKRPNTTITKFEALMNQLLGLIKTQRKKMHQERHMGKKY
jgi:hypothetical protein